MRFPLLFSVLALAFTAVPAFADCTGPAGSAGAMDYFGAPENVFKFCNGAEWVSMAGGSGGDIPSGAVMAFTLTSCPAGWSEYTQARGRFLRGIDNGAGNDPDGTRAPGDVQDDELKSHAHTFIGSNISNAQYDATNTEAGNKGSQTRETDSAGGPETRPKNVAVLFCYKL